MTRRLTILACPFLELQVCISRGHLQVVSTVFEML